MTLQYNVRAVIIMLHVTGTAVAASMLMASRVARDHVVSRIGRAPAAAQLTADNRSNPVLHWPAPSRR